MTAKRFFIVSPVSLLIGVVIFGGSCLAAGKTDPFSAESTDHGIWGPRLPDDAIMPKKDVVLGIDKWCRESFSGKQTESIPQNVELRIIKQEHATLKCGESCMGTPLAIGSKKFERGLGTHAGSELEFTFPEPIKRFTAVIGIDNNYSTGGVRGSVQFVVMAGNEELFRSPVQKGSDGPLAIDVAIPEAVNKLTLLLDTTKDGPAFDQADWCDPIVFGASGRKFDLSDIVLTPMRTEIPFSFRYGGESSRKFLASWKYESRRIDEFNDVHSWADPKTGLKIDAHVRRFGRFAAAEWTLRFTNTGTSETPLIDEVKAVDLVFEMGIDQDPILVNTLSGDSCDANSWLPVKFPLRPGDTKRFAPKGGRSSNGAFPFWNVQRKEAADDAVSEGIFVALGWSGQWTAAFSRTDKNAASVNAGMENFASVLLPKESIRTPKILIMPWKSDRLSANALFRRLLMFEYAPKMSDELPQKMMIVGQCFDRYYRKRAGWEKIDAQIEYAKKLSEAGCDAHWFDAAWFPVGFPNGVGNWYSDPTGFPSGLGELGKNVHELNMKFVLWFEPERVAKDTQIANEHPEFVFGGKEGGLYKLNDPSAREFMSDLLLKRIDEFGVDVYRNDFNIDPLDFWNANDAPNRTGMTEIRYVEGLYEMWGRIIKENPGLWIDNCASGGRRIDLETLSISVPLWRSDTCCWPGHPEWDQTQTLGISQYVPLYSCSAWEPDPYVFRSGANMGAIAQFNFLDDDYDLEMSKKALQEAKINSKFWYGDFYPLTEAVSGVHGITGWQLHRSDLDAGLVYVFRQPQSPYLGMELALRGIDPAGKYRISIKKDYSEGETREISGADLLKLQIPLPEKRSTVIVQYSEL